ncbi:hypothetical protein KAU45_07660, partial [bacterium]|nr:hypothetical protein [bacterium]
LALSGIDRPHYTWEELYEPEFEIIGKGYTIRWEPWQDIAYLERNGRNFEIALDADSFILGCVDDYLYLGQELWDEAELLGLKIRRMHVDDVDLGFFVDMYELVCPLHYADFALSPDAKLLAVATGGDEHKVDVHVYRLGRECEIVHQRVFGVETYQIRVSVHLLEWSDDGKSLYMNFHPHSPASDEFLDLQPLQRWDIEEDEVTEVLSKVGWILPVAGRGGEDRTVVLAEEIVPEKATWTMPWGYSPGRPPYELTRWLELDLATGELTPALATDPPGAEHLFDGDPSTVWYSREVALDLGRPLPLDGFLVIGGYAESGETTPEDTVTWDTWFELEPHESPYELRGSTERIPVGEVVESVVLTGLANNPDRIEHAVTAELVPRFAFWPVP